MPRLLSALRSAIHDRQRKLRGLRRAGAGCLPVREVNALRHLSFGLPSGIVASCRFTSFIAKSATATAKFWCGPVIGRAQSAPDAARPSWPRNFQPSRRPRPGMPAAPHQPARATPVLAAPAEQAGLTGIEVWSWRSAPSLVLAVTERRYEQTFAARISRKSSTSQSGACGSNSSTV